MRCTFYSTRSVRLAGFAIFMVLVYGQDPSEKGKMFYQGALQDGISAAVAQQKTVLCFVTNDNEESATWENEYLQDEAISELIEKNAVALRLTAGSDEAGYLAQIFPLPQTPTVVIMKNGELKEYLIPGVSKEEFMRRIQKTFSVDSQASSAAASTPAQTQPAEPQAEPNPATSAAAAAQSERIRRVLAERAIRIAAEKEEADRKEKEKRAKAKEKGKADEEAGVQSDEAKARKLAEQYKQKRKEEEEERKRVLKRIEDDRAERRLRAEERQKERLARQSVGDVAAALVNSPESKLPSFTKPGVMTYIQVRLFDGSTIRSRFETDEPLRSVRRWVDESRTDGKEPYTFRKVLTPLSNKKIDATEENKSLGALELSPSSTLILIPVPVYTSAYEDRSGNIFSTLIAKILGFFTWLFGLFGLGRARPAERSGSSTPEQDEGSASTPDTNRVRGFQDKNDKLRDQQLYNGNSIRSFSSLLGVLAGGSLAGLELLEVPVADLHVAVVLVHALGEVLGGALAVVVGVPRLLLGSGLGLDGLGSGLSRGGGAAAEKATDGVADGGADGNTTVRC
ncbi:UBX7 UBX (ubiquitin regulatory X) domain-containing [Paramyrothecium foliicola]|nr:UBX7 UBX (ubiquitin regulatory X) domain-containing [Paramyrothecium foliicola]